MVIRIPGMNRQENLLSESKLVSSIFVVILLRTGLETDIDSETNIVAWV